VFWLLFIVLPRLDCVVQEYTYFGHLVGLDITFSVVASDTCFQPKLQVLFWHTEMCISTNAPGSCHVTAR